MPGNKKSDSAMIANEDKDSPKMKQIDHFHEGKMALFPNKQINVR